MKVITRIFDLEESNLDKIDDIGSRVKFEKVPSKEQKKLAREHVYALEVERGSVDESSASYFNSDPELSEIRRWSAKELASMWTVAGHASK